MCTKLAIVAGGPTLYHICPISAAPYLPRIFVYRGIFYGCLKGDREKNNHQTQRLRPGYGYNGLQAALFQHKLEQVPMIGIDGKMWLMVSQWISMVMNGILMRYDNIVND